MIRFDIFHPELLKALAGSRHLDMIMITDAAFAVPQGVKRIDLGWKKGSPGSIEVLRAVLEAEFIEKAVFAEEVKKASPEYDEAVRGVFPEGVEIGYIPHMELKALANKAAVVISTGEFTPYTNVILYVGSAY